NELAQYNSYADDAVYINSFYGVKEQKNRNYTFTAFRLMQVLTEFQALNKCKKHELVAIRFLAWKYVTDNMPKVPYSVIGKVTGHDHSTVMYGSAEAENLLTSKAPNFVKKHKDAVFTKCDEVFKNKYDGKE
ncbi:MAG: hypothetical protein ACKO96_15295, partial [Flammeovirgaceae bacterium]